MKHLTSPASKTFRRGAVASTVLMVMTVMALSVSTSGCATRPYGTPGSGYGADYTPVVDLRGTNAYQYNSDLDQCRGYAQQVSAGDGVVNGALTGAVVGGVLSAAMGNNSRANRRTALVGALVGGAANGSSSLLRQQQIMIRCLAGRGYRVLG